MDLNTKVEVSDPSRFPGLRFPMILSDNLVGYGFNVHDDFVRPGYLLEEQSRGGLTVRMTLTADEPTVLASCAIYGDGRYPVLKNLFELMDAMPGILAQLERAERDEKFRAEFA